MASLCMLRHQLYKLEKERNRHSAHSGRHVDTTKLSEEFIVAQITLKSK